MNRKGRRGQAAAASALIAAIAGLIILYIIFLQPEDRAKLLGEGTTSRTGGVRAVERNLTLLDESPGRIDFLSQRVVDHTIPATHVFTRTSGLVLEKKDSLTVKRSLFSSTEAEMVFQVDDLANTNNALLSFTIGRSRGDLVVLLNDQEILNKEIVTVNIEPVSLPQRLLKAENKLVFRVSSPGVAFWRTHEYALEEVQVTADVTRTDAKRSKNVFLVSALESNNIDRAALRFQPDCSRGSGPLDIWVNTYNIYSGIPDCGVTRERIEFAPTYLHVGENEIVFSIENGDYSISQIAVESQLKQIDFPAYFFELSEEQFRDIKNNTKEVVLRMDFVDTTERKQGQIFVNGHTVGFDTKNLFIEEEITKDVEKGSNSIKIKPEKTIDVRKLTVRLVKD